MPTSGISMLSPSERRSIWDKFVLLVWKNWKIQWYNKKELILLILQTILFPAVILYLRVTTKVEDHASSKFASSNLLFSGNDYNSEIEQWEIAYYPKGPCLDEVAQSALGWIKSNNDVSKASFSVKGYENVDDLEKSMQANKIIAALQFDESFLNAKQCPHKISYSMRFPSELRSKSDKVSVMSNWQTNTLFPIQDFGGLRYSEDILVDSNPSYYNQGFIGIQHAFAMGFIEKLKTVADAVPTIKIKRFPYPPHILDSFLKTMGTFIPMLFAFSFFFLFSDIVKCITTEKEKQLKEVMKIMGLSNWLHWTAWFVKSYSFALICGVIIVILFKVNFSNVSVLPYSHWSTLLFFQYVYFIPLVTFSFMVASFFSKANTAAVVGGLFFILSLLIFMLFGTSYSTLSLPGKLGLSLFSNTAMAFGFKLILKLEGTGEGLQWDNMFRPVNVDDNISVGVFAIMLLVDSFLYMIIALYVEKVVPGSYGIPEKWYFPFTKTFWCKKKTSYEENINSAEHVVRSNPAAFEIEPKNKKVGLSVRNLQKDFGDKTAVKNLSINLYEDEITALLGHNGAGKTTTMSMLTGIIPPTYGTANLNGYDIRTNLTKARMSLGFCPQHNILFDELTVREHIVFFSRLKGLKNNEIENEVQKYVELLELQQKVNTHSSKLSGGMKRKLSIAVALCGGSKVVLCDEPTSGMDPSARRALWDLLEKESKGRTILLSTHFMDEADILGDRIAIMCNGELKAYGTSFFLKKRYGAGYHLICVKKDDCDPKKVTKLLRQHIPDIVIENNIGSELSYQLPDRYSDRFEKMLTELEEHSDELKLNGYGISNTTLEEVFMLVGSDKPSTKRSESNDVDNNQIQYGNDKDERDSKIRERSGRDFFGDEVNLLTGVKLTISQWKAMILKKYLYTIRNLILLILQNCMPIFFILFTVLSYKSTDPFKTLKPLKLDFSKYSDTVTVLELKKSSENGFVNKIATEYKNYIENFGNNHKFIEINQNFDDYIIELGKKNLAGVNSRYITGSTIEPTQITAFFNGQLLHVLPLTLNTVHNALLRAATNDPSFLIEVTNHPFPFMDSTKLKAVGTQNFGTLLAFNLSYCMALVIPFFIMFQIKERVSRAKLLQFVSGVRILTFWITQFFFDYANYLITAIITVITIACFQEEGFQTGNELGRTFLVLILFGISSLPLTYLLAFLFSESATGYNNLTTYYLFTGFAHMINSMFSMSVDKNILAIVNSICLIFPHYLLAKALDNIYTISRTKSACLQNCNRIPPSMEIECNMENLCKSCNSLNICDQCCVPDYFAWEEPGIGAHILYTFGVFGFVITILLIKEYNLVNGIVSSIKMSLFEKFLKPKIETNTQLDDDVKEEKLRISRMSPEDIKNTNLVLDKVTKYYCRFLAVKEISAAVQHSECFGLLGVNGAGKTTTFKILTGEERITYGHAFVKGFSITTQKTNVYREIGYCPQFDALLEDLTGKEILRIFSLLRGIPEQHIDKISLELSKAFDYTKHYNKRVKAYSGGNKRKLSTSIALLGSPSIIYLDEPTTGMDPGAKRMLWNKVCQIRDMGKSIVLTSHSMEECEALCTRLAIMVNGEFKCIGSTQHLKNKFSKGLILKIKARKPEDIERKSKTTRLSAIATSNMESERIIQFVIKNFNQAELKEQRRGLLTFFIPLTSIRWSKIFGIMESNKKNLNIDDYSISQTTLEEIFLEFAKYQNNDQRIGQ